MDVVKEGRGEERRGEMEMELAVAGVDVGSAGRWQFYQDLDQSFDGHRSLKTQKRDM